MTESSLVSTHAKISGRSSSPLEGGKGRGEEGAGMQMGGKGRGEQGIMGGDRKG